MALIIQDNFGGEVGKTNLNLHNTTLNGYSWIKDDPTGGDSYINDLVSNIVSARAIDGLFHEYYVDHTPGTTDYKVKAKCLANNNTTANQASGVSARGLDTDDNFITAILIGGANGVRGVALYEGEDGIGLTEIAKYQFDWLNNTEYEIELEVINSVTANEIDCRVWVDGVLRINTATITNAAIYSRNGLGGLFGVAVTGALGWDDFEVNTFSQTITGTGNTTLAFDGSVSLKGGKVIAGGSTALAFNGSATVQAPIVATASTSLNFDGTAALQFDFSFKWSVEHLEASTTHGFPSVYVQVDNQAQPTDDFATLSGNDEVFERRLLEMPRLQEVQLDERSGLAGFQRVTLQADNSDGLLNGLELQDSFVRIFFVDADGADYKEFNGKVVDWTLSHTVTINVEDLDALAFTQELPKRTLNDLVEAEKEALTGDDLDEFEDSVVSDDLGKPIPIIFGRAVKVPLLYVKADETLVMGESKREYDYIIGEGVGLGGNFQEVFTVYREDQALDNWSFNTPNSGTTTTVPLSNSDPDLRRPDGWYKYWWVFGGGHIRYVTAYDSQTNTITVDSPFPVSVPNNFPFELREWRFYDGSQTSPYNGYAFIRFKKRLGNSGSTDQLYADVNGLETEANRAKAVQSILSNSDWGLGLDVDSDSFDTAATVITNEVGDFTCEGAIIDKTSATDVFQKLLSFRDMILYKEDSVKISVDQEKTSTFNFGLGDETGYNNILTQSPSVSFKHPDQKVKDLKVRYRKNNRENDTYLHEFTRSSSTSGVDETMDLPFVYNHEVADRVLDYKRKRYAAADRTLSLDVGEDGKKSKRGDLATVDISSLGIISDWEVASSNVTPAGSNTVNLVPYRSTPYTYDQNPDLPDDETGIQEPFDIPPDYTNTPPEPVTGVTVSRGVDVKGISGTPFMIVSWTPPTDGNYGGAEVSMKLSSDPANDWKSKGIVDGDNIRIDGLVPGQSYIFLVESLNFTKELKGIGILSTDQVAGGSAGPPNRPATPTATERLGKVIFKWAPNSEQDISHYVPTVYDAEFNGNRVAVLPVVQHDHNNPNFSPEIEYQANSGELTTTNNPAWLEVVAVNYTLQESTPSLRGGISVTTPIDTPDIGDGAVTNSKVANLSADKITTGSLDAGLINTGQLEITGTGVNEVDLLVTGGGASVWEDGGDIIMKTSASGDPSILEIRNSSNSPRLRMGYLTSGSPIDNGQVSAIVTDAGDLQITANRYLILNGGIAAGLASNLLPFSDSTYDLGSLGGRWRHIYTDNITSATALTVGDIKLGGGKGFIITEPDKVYKNKKVDDGLVFMSNDWKVVMYFDNHTKTLKVAGNIESGCDFPEPDIPRTESPSIKNKEK